MRQHIKIFVWQLTRSTSRRFVRYFTTRLAVDNRCPTRSIWMWRTVGRQISPDTWKYQIIPTIAYDTRIGTFTMIFHRLNHDMRVTIHLALHGTETLVCAHQQYVHVIACYCTKSTNKSIQFEWHLHGKLCYTSNKLVPLIIAETHNFRNDGIVEIFNDNVQHRWQTVCGIIP